MKHTFFKHTLAYVLIGCIAVLPNLTVQALQFVQQKSVAGISTDITLNDVPSNAEALLVLPPFGNELYYQLSNQPKQVVRLSGSDLEIAGEYRLSVLADDQIVDTSTLHVSPSSFSANHSGVSADTQFTDTSGQVPTTVTVVARDEFGNVLSNRPMQLVSSRNQDSITPLSRETDENGEQHFAVRTLSNGSSVLRAIDLITGDAIAHTLTLNEHTMPYGAFGGPTQTSSTPTFAQSNTNSSAYQSPFAGSALNYRALYGQAAQFETASYIELDTTPNVQANVDQNLTITIKDSNGLTVEDFTGEIELASTDPNAILPSFGTVVFTPSDLGRKQLVLGLRFGTTGNHLLYAESRANENVNGQTEVMVTGTNTVPAVTQKITVFSPAPESTLNTNQITLQGKGPAFVNLVVSGGDTNVISETDANGNFTVIVPLGPGTEHTLRVKNDTGTADSGDLLYYTDTTPPEITAVEFDPVSPIANQDVLISVRVNEPENRMKAVTALLNNQEVTFEFIEDGLYQYVYTPSEAGMLRANVTAFDKANNTSQLQSMVEVQPPVIPTVQNVGGIIEENVAIVQWDPITNVDIDGYRIYIGDENPGSYTYTLETTLTEAKINGLAPGATYYIAIAATKGNRESRQKSEELVLQSPKTSLTATSTENGVLLEWQSPLEASSIATFRLRYGIQPDNLIEERLLNGQLRRYDVSNLIDEETYYFELVPITITGQLLEEATATAEATVGATSGLHSGAPDPVPDNILANIGKGKGKGPIVNPDVVPDQPSTGAMTLPMVLGAAVLFCAGYFVWIKRRQQQLDEAFFLKMQTMYTNQ